MQRSARCLLGCRAGTAPVAGGGPAGRYVRCQMCGLVFEARPEPKEQIERRYRDDRNSPSAYYTSSVDEDRATFRRRLKLLTAFGPGRGRLLDIGCSVGTLMDEARKLGWQASGIEPNPRSAGQARRLGLPVVCEFLGSSAIADVGSGLECVVLSDVLEHLPDPAAALGLVHGILAPGGLVMASTPNMQSIWCRALQMKPGEHLFLFSPGNLRLLFESAGFTICHLQSTSRRRALSRLEFSTTRLPVLLKSILELLVSLRLDGPLSWLMEELFRDELLVIARKAG